VNFNNLTHIPDMDIPEKKRSDMVALLPTLNTALSRAVAARRFDSSIFSIWVFLKIGVSQNGWFIMENPIKSG